MKTKIFLVFAVCILCFGVAMAEDTGKSNPDYDLGFVNKLINHDHFYEKFDRDNPVGIGTDILVYEDKDSWFEAVNLELKGDLVNKEFSAFAVAKIDGRGAIDAIWDFFLGRGDE